MPPPHPIVVTIDDFLSTYNTKRDKGREVVDNYNTAFELYQQGTPIQDIAHKLQRKPTTVKSWLRFNKVPHPVRALQEAVDLGVFPNGESLNVENALFPSLNLLASKVFSTGSLFMPRGKQTVVNFCIVGEEAHLLDLARYFHENLGLEPRVSRKTNVFAGGYLLHGGFHAALYSRLMYSMGISLSDDERKCPSYLENIIRTDSKNLSQKMMTIARQFLYVLFEERLHGGGNVLDLHACTRKQEAQAYAKSIMELINFAFTNLHLTQDDIRIRKRQSDKYTHRRCYHPKIVFGAGRLPLLSVYHEVIVYDSVPTRSHLLT